VRHRTREILSESRSGSIQIDLPGGYVLVWFQSSCCDYICCWVEPTCVTPARAWHQMDIATHEDYWYSRPSGIGHCSTVIWTARQAGGRRERSMERDPSPVINGPQSMDEDRP